MTNNPISLEEMAKMSFGEISALSPEQQEALLAEALEQIRKAKLARDWLKAIIARRRNHKPKVVAGTDTQK